MRALIVYDSLYGNTQKIAVAIAKIINSKALITEEVNINSLSSLDLLIVGSPVHGGRPSPKMQAWLNSIPSAGLKKVKVAAFDTRMEIWIAKLFGYAAPKIELALIDRGAQLAAANIGFIVTEKEGPLKAGELARAASWAKSFA